MTISRKALATLSDQDYAALADFRYVLRKFMAFSEAEAAQHGLTPQQHQALLAIRAAPGDSATVGYVAERLLLKPHSATGLVNRLEVTGLVARKPAPQDRRCSTLSVSVKGRRCLDALSATHREEIKRLRPVLSQLVDRFQDEPSA